MTCFFAEKPIGESSPACHSDAGVQLDDSEDGDGKPTEFEYLLETLVTQKLSMLRSLALGIVHLSAEADDIVQNALVRAWRCRDRLRQAEALEAWVIRIVLSEAYQWQRNRSRAWRHGLAFGESLKAVPDAECLAVSWEHGPAINRNGGTNSGDDGDNGDGEANRAGEYGISETGTRGFLENEENPFAFCQLDQAIAQLPQCYREAVDLVLLHQFSGAAAAQVMHCQVNTVYQRVFQAKKLLRAALHTENEEI